MKLFSIWYHSKALLKRVYFKLVYGKKLKLGLKTTWRRNFSVLIEKNAHIEIGKGCFFNNDCSLVAMDNIKIGEGTLFGENVKIYDHNHKFNRIEVPIKEQGYSVKSVTIGKHCWIGSNVVILKGVHIGNNCVIGAGCVVSYSVPSNTIVKMKNIYEQEDLRIKK